MAFHAVLREQRAHLGFKELLLFDLVELLLLGISLGSAGNRHGKPHNDQPDQRENDSRSKKALQSRSTPDEQESAGQTD